MNRTAFDTKQQLDFFKNELTENLLSFLMERCPDWEHGGYFNCFSNDGSKLFSTDKYTWSMGRFLWMFSKLATMEGDCFTDAERKKFLELAKLGRDFLYKNVLIAPNDWRCVFLMYADGSPKYVDGYKELDMSISADCFVVEGFAKYAVAAGDRESWEFAKSLYESVWERYMSGNFLSLPYPVSPQYISRARPMILTNISVEMLLAAQVFEPEYEASLKERIAYSHKEIFEVFADENDLVHEFRYADGDFPNDMFGQHVNPGHTLEDMWFQLRAADMIGESKYFEQATRIVKSSFRLGWDEKFGGILHFAACDGSEGINGPLGEAKDEPQMKLVKDDWASKLWWVHSEGLYTTLLFFDRTGDPELLEMFNKLKDYTYNTFPNPDRQIREWIQIRTREGKPQEKVVALPVKDPYHIIRNMILIIELLQNRLKKES